MVVVKSYYDCIDCTLTVTDWMYFLIIPVGIANPQLMALQRVAKVIRFGQGCEGGAPVMKLAPL